MNNYFVWDGSPIMFDLGVMNLPFAISIPGIVVAIALYFGGIYFLSNSAGKDSKSKRRRKKSDESASPLNSLQLWGIGIGAFAVGQLLFIASDAGTISQIGPIAVRWYGLMFALSFLIGYYLGGKTFEHAGKPHQQPETLFIYLIAGTVLGARFGHVFFYDFDYYIMNLHEIFYFWQGGLASHGAVVGVLTAVWAFSRKFPDSGFLWTADRMTIPFALGGMFVRIGNFFNSEILGRETDVSWAVIFVREDLLPRHPSMLYESFLYLVVFGILVATYKYFKNNPPIGALSGIFMIGIFLSRFVIEYTKERQPGFDETLTFLSMGQILSIPFILIGIWLLSRVDWKQAFAARQSTPSNS